MALKISIWPRIQASFAPEAERTLVTLNCRTILLEPSERALRKTMAKVATMFDGVCYF